jgi:ribosome maturation protein Sdo1
MELEAGELRLLLRTVVDCHVVKVYRTSTISPVMRLKEVCNEDLAAEGMWVGWCCAEFISAGCHIDITAQLEDLTTHVYASVLITG